MDRDEVINKVTDIVCEMLGKEASEVKLESSFVDDLGADSLDTVELVMQLEEEFDLTIVDDDAENISTGLRQKLQIARALIRNPRILILDDAISGFDIDSEIKLYDSLSDISVGRTVIIISNRLWHLRTCNKIFVLDNGTITQNGSFEELSRNDGFFKNSLQKQMNILGISNREKLKKVI